MIDGNLIGSFIPLNIKKIINIQHDGGSTHSARQVIQNLKSVIPRRWIGKRGPIFEDLVQK